MSSAHLNERNNRGARQRGHKACRRCRSQKIRCSGSAPCESCKRRALACEFEEQTDKIVVTRRYIDSLRERLASLERRVQHSESPAAADAQFSSPQHDDDYSLQDHRDADPAIEGMLGEGPNGLAKSECEAPLTNPLAFHTTDWVPGPGGLPMFMGTSSNWAFGRRVLTMTYESLMRASLPTSGLLFDNNVYDLKWNGDRAEAAARSPILPTQEFALHLINIFKFHCGKLFYLFEEDSFMKQFSLFHQDPTDRSRLSTLWHVHYLLILALGQAFGNRSARAQRPSGAELFVQAMRLMPDLTFVKAAGPIEKIHVLACAALYLQCIFYRPAAYQTIVRALSIALENGMHTEMQSQYISADFVQTCRTTWWTVYILERRMASLLGVPMAIAEESISTPIPTTFPGHQEFPNALKLQIRLAQTLAMIDQTVYGIDGKLDSRYLGATQLVLRKVADITEQLNELFTIQANDSTCGISRISAHLHLQQHHCVILTTRPLLYIFLHAKLGHSESVTINWLQSETVHRLLQICVESSQQTLRILSQLLDQGLLETFLPFDLDAAFASTIALLMASAIDHSLIHDHSPWSQRAYVILDEMDSRGNSIAMMVRSELKMLDELLARLARGWESGHHVGREEEQQQQQESSDSISSGPMINNTCLTTGGGDNITEMHAAQAAQAVDSLVDCSAEFGLYHGLDAEQLMHLADSLDLDSLAWPLPIAADADLPSQSQRM